MRDLILLLVFGVGVLYALRRPFVGVMLFMWISVMNPHRYAWGFVYTLPLAQVAALATIASLALHTDEMRFPRTRETLLFLLLWCWTTLSTFFAFYPDRAFDEWNMVTKIFFMTLVAMVLLTTRARVTWFLLALTGFVGFVGVKGALFGIVTRGEYKIWGPPDSFLEGENSMALAMVMIIPFCFLLRPLVQQKWLSRTMLVVGFSQILSTLLTYSRGGLVGLAAVCSLCILYSRRKLLVLGVAASVLFAGLAFLPSKWKSRMSTIKTYEQDASANMRLNSWTMAVNMAKDHPLFGGGFDCFTMEQYERYAPHPEWGRTFTGEGSTAHSIYFEVMAMHGFVGFAIFLAALFAMLASMWRIQRQAQLDRRPDITAFARSVLVSVIGFMISGAFLSRAFFDLFWAIFAAGLCFKVLVDTKSWGEIPITPPAQARETGRLPELSSTRSLLKARP